jgi:hypothetical protein
LINPCFIYGPHTQVEESNTSTQELVRSGPSLDALQELPGSRALRSGQSLEALEETEAEDVGEHPAPDEQSIPARQPDQPSPYAPSIVRLLNALDKHANGSTSADDTLPGIIGFAKADETVADRDAAGASIVDPPPASASVVAIAEASVAHGRGDKCADARLDSRVQFCMHSCI